MYINKFKPSGVGNLDVAPLAGPPLRGSPSELDKLLKVIKFVFFWVFLFSFHLFAISMNYNNNLK